MCSCVTKYNIWCNLTQSWIRSTRVLKMSLIWQICHRRLYYYIHFLKSEYLPRDWQSTLLRVKTGRFYFTRQFYFSLPLNRYIYANLLILYPPLSCPHPAYTVFPRESQKKMLPFYFTQDITTSKCLLTSLIHPETHRNIIQYQLQHN